MLTLENISVSLAGVSILRGISTEFSSGKMHAIVGRNGAGKTTLLRLIMGFLPQHSGKFFMDGVDLTKVPACDRARLGIGYAPEDRVLFPSFSVEENLRFPCEVIGLSKNNVDRRLEETLSIVPELKAMLPRSGSALSGGQGKMAALGRAVMTGSSLVLLDEPMQGLAPTLAQQYATSLNRLQQLKPALCIVITESNESLLRGIPTQHTVLERGALQVQAASQSASNTAQN